MRIASSSSPTVALRRGKLRSYHLQQHQQLPPDFFFHPPQNDKGKGRETPPGDKMERVSDSEWNLRVGRASYILESTLPEFFNTGLITSSSSLNAHLQTNSDGESDATIYSKSICLTYTPPSPLPSPLPRTLRIEGLPLYQASAVFMRTSLLTLYADCAVNILRKNVISPAKREHKLQMTMCVTGQSRLTGAPAEWDVRCVYSFSPMTGLIYLHQVDSIDPAPHIHAYDALRLALAKVLGIGVGDPKMPDVGSAGKVPTSSHGENGCGPAS